MLSEIIIYLLFSKCFQNKLVTIMLNIYKGPYITYKRAILHDNLYKKDCKLLEYKQVLKSIKTILKRKSI